MISLAFGILKEENKFMKTDNKLVVVRSGRGEQNE